MRARCSICGAARAPFGFRPAGLRRDLPEDLRGAYLWVCEDLACQTRARQRVMEVSTKRNLIQARS